MSLQPHEKGYILLIIGPMFASKTTELLDRARKFEERGFDVLYIKHSYDGRYKADHIISHDLRSHQAMSMEYLSQCESQIKDFHKYQIIVIDEGHFFQDVDIYPERWANQGKYVIVASLDSTFRRLPFNSISALACQADEKICLVANCAYCKLRRAPYTVRTQKDTSGSLVGGPEAYQPACRVCWIKFSPFGQPKNKQEVLSVLDPESQYQQNEQGNNGNTLAQHGDNNVAATPGAPLLN